MNPSVAWMDGCLVDFRKAALPVEDRAVQFGESLYEVVAVTAGKPRLLERHAERMAKGAEILELPGGVPMVEEWGAIADALLVRDSIGEGLLYAQITGGVAARQHLPTVASPPHFFAYVRGFRFPRHAEVTAGIRAITMPDPRWQRSDLKTTMLLPAVLARRQAQRQGAKEAIMLAQDGVVREGAATNVFLVEGKKVVTPEQTHHLLPGLTRDTLGPLVTEAGLEMASEPVDVARLLAADEVFVTSTTILVMPVTAIDGQSIGVAKREEWRPIWRRATVGGWSWSSGGAQPL